MQLFHLLIHILWQILCIFRLLFQVILYIVFCLNFFLCFLLFLLLYRSCLIAIHQLSVFLFLILSVHSVFHRLVILFQSFLLNRFIGYVSLSDFLLIMCSSAICVMYFCNCPLSKFVPFMFRFLFSIEIFSPLFLLLLVDRKSVV